MMKLYIGVMAILIAFGCCAGCGTTNNCNSNAHSSTSCNIVSGIGGQATGAANGSRPSGSASSSPLATLDRSPILGISFYQNGQLTSMSLSDSTATIENSEVDTVDVSMRNEPFELWFPTLGDSSGLAICASPNRAIFNASNATTCLSPGRTVIDYPYGHGGFWVTRDPSDPINTGVSTSRAEPASNGDQKFYVGNLVRFNEKRFYIAICRDDEKSWTLKVHNNIEFFVLNFS